MKSHVRVGVTDSGLMDRRRSSAQTVCRLVGSGTAPSSTRSTRLFNLESRDHPSHSLRTSSDKQRYRHEHHIRPLVFDFSVVQKEREAESRRHHDDPRSMLGLHMPTATCTTSSAKIVPSMASTPLSQRLRRAIVDDDLVMARRIAAYTQSLHDDYHSQHPEMAGSDGDEKESALYGSAAKRARARQRRMLNPQNKGWHSIPSLVTQNSRHQIKTRFCIRNLDSRECYSQSHRSLGKAENYQQPTTGIPPRGSLDAERDGSRSSLELAVLYGCSIELIEWLLDMGHEDYSHSDARSFEQDPSGRISFTRDAQGRSIPHLAAICNRPDVITLYCSHVHFILSLPRAMSSCDQQALSKDDDSLKLSSDEDRRTIGGLESGPTTRPPSRHHMPEAISPLRSAGVAHDNSVHGLGENPLGFEDARQTLAALLDSPCTVSSTFGVHQQQHLRTYSSLLNPLPPEGRCALHDAAMRGLDSVIVVLLGLGADPQRLDACGNTALHYASSFGHLTTLQLLIEAPLRNFDHKSVDHQPLSFGLSASIPATSPARLTANDESDNVSHRGAGGRFAALLLAVSSAGRSTFGTRNDGGFSAADYAFTFGDKAALEALGRRWFAESREAARRMNRQAAEQAAAAAAATAATATPSTNLVAEQVQLVDHMAQERHERVQNPEAMLTPPPRPSSAGLIREHFPNLHGSGLLRSAANTMATKRAALTNAAGQCRERDVVPFPAGMTASSSSPSASPNFLATAPLTASEPSVGFAVSPKFQMEDSAPGSSSPPPTASVGGALGALTSSDGLSKVSGGSTHTNNSASNSLTCSLRRRGPALDRIKNGAKEAMSISRGPPTSPLHLNSPVSATPALDITGRESSTSSLERSRPAIVRPEARLATPALTAYSRRANNVDVSNTMS